MKHNRSSTFSSPYDSYLYSQDSVEMNNNSLINQQKIEESPFQKLRGHTVASSFHQKSQESNILNTSPFMDNSSTIGLPITYLNITHNPNYTNSALSSNQNQLQELQPGSLQDKLVNYEDQFQKKRNAKHGYQNIDYETEAVNQIKFDDQQTTSEVNSALNTGTFGHSIGDDAIYQPGSNRFQKETIPQKVQNAAYESPYSKNISTDYKTSVSLNENLGSAGKSKVLSSLTSQFTPSPLQQTKQQTILTESGKQYDYKLSSPYQNSVLFQSNESEVQNKQEDKQNQSTLKNLQNENIMLPKIQALDSNKQVINLNSILNGIQEYNLKIGNNNSSNNNSFLTSGSNQYNYNNESNKNILNNTSNQNNISGINQNSISSNRVTTFSNNTSSQPQFQNIKNNDPIQRNGFNNTLPIQSNNLSHQKQRSTENNSNKSNPSLQNNSSSQQFFFKKQFTFSHQQSTEAIEPNENSKIKTEGNDRANRVNQPVQHVRSQSSFTQLQSHQIQGFNPQQLITNVSEHMLTNQSGSTPQKVPNNQPPQSSMNEFYEQMLRSHDDPIEENYNQNNQNQQTPVNESINIESEYEEEKMEEQRKHAAGLNTNSKQKVQMDQKVNLMNDDIDRLSTILKDSEKNTQDQHRDLIKLQSERDHLQEFVRNMETRNKLLNERIYLLESNLQSLNTQNIENIDKIVKLNTKIAEYEKNLAQKNQTNQNIQIGGLTQQSKELLEAAQRQDNLQQEIRQLIQKDLGQEKKILELMSNLNVLQSIRNEYDKAISEQEILVKNNKSNLSTIDQQKNEIIRLSNIITNSNQDLQQSKVVLDKVQLEKKIVDTELQKLQEKNKTLEEHVSTMKVSCLKLETAMTANCNQTKDWLEKYNTLEKNYLNLQNQFRIEQQKQMMEKIPNSKKDIFSSKSQQSLNKFKSELSDTELNVQISKNQELILSEIQSERNHLSSENDQLKQKINELTNSNTQLQQRIQFIQQTSQKQLEENDIQRKDLINKLNLMINENTKLIAVNNDRPVLLQKVQQLTYQLDYIKSKGDLNKPLTTLSNLESSGLSLQPPQQFNSHLEEAKWYKLRCNQLEVKLKVKSEEYAELIYQNKILKRQVKVNPQEDLAIKSSLYQNINQSNSSSFLRQANKQQQEIVINGNKQQIIYETSEESRGCCDKKPPNRVYDNTHNIHNDINSETDRDSVACNVRCI